MKLNKEVFEKAVNPPELYKIVKKVNITYDGRQFLIRFPKKIARAFNLARGDMVRFELEVPPIDSKKQIKGSISFVQNEKENHVFIKRNKHAKG